MTWGDLSTTIRLLQLERLDTHWLLAGATKSRLATWSAIPDYYGIEFLLQCGKCFDSDGNSGPSTPAHRPTADPLRAAELLKSKTTEST